MIGTLDTMLDDFGRRLYSLEQTVTGSVQNEFSEIIVDDGTNPPVVITPQPPGIPTGLTATPGSFFDVIYADIEWTPAVGGEPAYVYEIEVAKKVAGVYQTAFVDRTAGTNFRIQPLEPNTTYGVRVTAFSILGVFDSATAWVDFNSGVDTTIPSAPTGVTIARGATSVIVKFTGSSSADVAGGKGIYVIEIDTSLAFNTGNKRTVNTTGTIFAFSDITSETTWYARVAAIDSSGNQSAWATSTGYTAGAIVDNMIVAGLDAAKITFGTMSGDRITANTLDVATIKTSTLTSADITVNGGSIKIGNPPTTGVLINSQGIRLYNAGALKVIMDAATGSATFRGNIDSSSISSTTITGGTITGAVFQTNTSGARLVIDQNDLDRIKLYRSDGTLVAYIGNSAISGRMAINVWSGGDIDFTKDGDTRGPLLYAKGIIVDYINTINQTLGNSLGGATSIDGNLTLSNIGRIRVGTGAADKGAMSINAQGGIWDNGFRVWSNAQQPTSWSPAATISLQGGNVTINTGGALSAQSIIAGAAFITMPVDTTSPLVRVNLSTTRVGVDFSSIRIKHSVEDLHSELEVDSTFMKLRPRFWSSRLHEGDLGGDDDPNARHYGFIAEEVAEVDRRFVHVDAEGLPAAINWFSILTLMVAEVQDLRKQVDRLLKAA